MSAIPAARFGLPWSLRLQDAWERLSDSPAVRQAALIIGVILFGILWGIAVSFAAVGTALLAISFVACLLCLRDFRVGVMLLIVIMPISQSALFPHAMFGLTGFNPLNLLLVATLAVFLMRSLGSEMMRGFVPAPLFWLYLLPLLMGALIGMQHVQEIPRIFKASDMIYFDAPGGYLRDMFLKPLGFVVYALLVAAAVAWSKRPERFVIPMLVSVFVMAAMAIGFVATSGASLSSLAGTYARQFMSTLGMHANDLGRLYATAFALMLFVWDRASTFFLKSLLFVAMLVVALALLLTFSRGAFFGFAIVCVLYLALRRSIKTLILAVLLVPAALILAPGAFYYRLQAGVGDGLNEITAGRLDDIWIPLIPEILKSPPWGNGLGSVMWSDAMKFEEIFTVSHPHNAYLQVYMDLGVIGTVLLLAFWFYAIVKLWQLSNDERLRPEMQGYFEGAAVGVVAFLVTGIAGTSFMPVPEQVYLWLSLGLMWGVRHHLARAEG